MNIEQNEKSAEKSAIVSNTGSAAYADAARETWGKPTKGSGNVDSTGSQPEQGNSTTTDQITSKSGNNTVGNDGQPGGGGSTLLENQDGSAAAGSRAGEKTSTGDKNVPSASGESNFAPTDELKVPKGEAAPTGEGSHSEKAAPKVKADAALQHLPSLSIV